MNYKLSFYTISPAIKLIAACFLLALILQSWFLWFSGHWTGAFEYDDGVYFGATWALVHGLFPYRNFVMVQPPGITLLLAPIAILGKYIGEYHALLVARGLIVLISSFNVLLAGLLVRKERLLVVTIVCVGMLIYPLNTLSSSAILIEPPLALACLLALNVLFEQQHLTTTIWKITASGLILACALDLKLWALLIIFVLGLLFVLKRQWTSLRYYIFGLGGGFTLFMLPFILLSPTNFWHEVILAQLTRLSNNRFPIFYRLEFLSGLWANYQATTNNLVVLSATALFVIAVLTVLYRLSRFSKPADLELTLIIITTLIFISFMLPTEFYYHYAVFFISFALILLALSIGKIIPSLHLSPAIFALGMGFIVVFGALLPTYYSAPPQLYPLSTLIPSSRCILSYNIENLVDMGKLSFSPGCPVFIDGYGVVLLEKSEHWSSRKIVENQLSSLKKASCVLFFPRNTPPILASIPIQQYLHLHFPLPLTPAYPWSCRE